MNELPRTLPSCQRWSNGTHSWRHRFEGGFDADRYTVEPLPELDAKAFVIRHHYSGSYPAAVQRFGLRENGELVGAAVFGVPMAAAVLTNVFVDLAPVVEALECSRFVLIDQVPANAESWFLARSFTELTHSGIRGVVAFSDPVPRRTDDGTLICPGHVGTIYQASNAVYLGRSTSRTHTLLPDGTVLTARAAQKVRRSERGADYVIRRLVDLGAPAPAAFMDPGDWLGLALESIGARRQRHAGCHRYAFTLGRNARQRRSVRIGLPRGSYPKRDEWVGRSMTAAVSHEEFVRAKSSVSDAHGFDVDAINRGSCG